MDELPKGLLAISPDEEPKVVDFDTKKVKCFGHCWHIKSYNKQVCCWCGHEKKEHGPYASSWTRVNEL